MAYAFMRTMVQTRSKGHTATGAVCYRMGLASASTIPGADGLERRFDYTRRTGILATGHAAPPGTDPSWGDPLTWAHRIEAVDKRKNSRQCRDDVVGIPVELVEAGVADESDPGLRRPARRGAQDGRPLRAAPPRPRGQEPPRARPLSRAACGGDDVRSEAGPHAGQPRTTGRSGSGHEAQGVLVRDLPRPRHRAGLDERGPRAPPRTGAVRGEARPAGRGDPREDPRDGRRLDAGGAGPGRADPAGGGRDRHPGQRRVDGEGDARARAAGGPARPARAAAGAGAGAVSARGPSGENHSRRPSGENHSRRPSGENHSRRFRREPFPTSFRREPFPTFFRREPFPTSFRRRKPFPMSCPRAWSRRFCGRCTTRRCSRPGRLRPGSSPTG